MHEVCCCLGEFQTAFHIISVHLWKDISHCADVLSFANQAMVVREVAPKLIDLLMYWVQSGSDYPVLFSKVISSSWAQEHLPVLSQHGHDPARFTTYTSLRTKAKVPITFTPSCPDDHILFTKFSLGQPRGQLAPCVQRCNQVMVFKQGKSGGSVRITCPGCRSSAMVEAYGTDRSTVLGRRQLVAVPYPQRLYIVETWTLPSQVDMGSIQGGSIQEAPAQSSGSKSTATPTTLPPETSHLVSNSPSTFPPPPNMMTRSMVPQPMPRKQLKRTPLPEEITRSSSLPVASTSDIPHSKRLTIRLPRKASTSALSMSAEGTRSTTATPPPPSPQEPPEPQSRKRSATNNWEPVFRKRPSAGPR